MSSAQYFQYSSRQSQSGSHVFHGEIMYTYSMAAWTAPKYAIFVPISPACIELRKIPWKHRNSTETVKFCGLAHNSTFCGKLWSLVINVVWMFQCWSVYRCGMLTRHLRAVSRWSVVRHSWPSLCHQRVVPTTSVTSRFSVFTLGLCQLT